MILAKKQNKSTVKEINVMLFLQNRDTKEIIIRNHKLNFLETLEHTPRENYEIIKVMVSSFEVIDTTERIKKIINEVIYCHYCNRNESKTQCEEDKKNEKCINQATQDILKVVEESLPKHKRF